MLQFTIINGVGEEKMFFHFRISALDKFLNDLPHSTSLARSKRPFNIYDNERTDFFRLLLLGVPRLIE